MPSISRLTTLSWSIMAILWGQWLSHLPQLLHCEAFDGLTAIAPIFCIYLNRTDLSSILIPEMTTLTCGWFQTQRNAHTAGDLFSLPLSNASLTCSGKCVTSLQSWKLCRKYFFCLIQLPNHKRRKFRSDFNLCSITSCQSFSKQRFVNSSAFSRKPHTAKA